MDLNMTPLRRDDRCYRSRRLQSPPLIQPRYTSAAFPFLIFLLLFVLIFFSSCSSIRPQTTVKLLEEIKPSRDYLTR